MLTKQQLLDKIQKYNINNNLNESLISDAYDFAEKAHEKQYRKSGALFLEHPINIATTLINLHFDYNTIIAALLHDVVEDTDITIKEIQKKFGNEVALLVDGVTKLSTIELKSTSQKTALNFGKLIMSMSKDIRVLIIKLADRLDNMRTLKYVSEKKQIQKANETMLIYVPLAEKIGMRQIKDELEDLAFSFLHPDERKKITEQVNKFKKEKIDIVERIIKELEFEIQKNHVKCTIYGRQKQIYSIWKKMQEKSISFDYLYDIMAFRIIVNDIQDCYKVLGIINSKYSTIHGRFKDYISTPKENGYKSIHTAVFGPENSKIEIQIRTKQMHHIAEFGLAAHWLYKEKNNDTKIEDLKKYSWIRELVSIFEQTKDSEVAFKDSEINLHTDSVFCFTPKGDVFNLTADSTIIDFAYAVHSDIGNKCIGAKVNGNISQLKTILNNGDEIQILTSKNAEPSDAWLNFVKTSKARSEIRQFTRSKRFTEYSTRGRAIIQKFFEEQEKEVTDAMIKKHLDKFDKKSVDSVYSFVGEGIITKFEVLKILYPEYVIKKTAADIEKKILSIKNLAKKLVRKKEKKEEIPIEEMFAGMAINFAKCCSPLPGDDILGIIKNGVGISIHKSDCKNCLTIQKMHPEKIYNLNWKQEIIDKKKGEVDKFIGRLKIGVLNKPGSLIKVVNLFSTKNIDIKSIKTDYNNETFNSLIIDFEIKSLEELLEFKSFLNTSPNICFVERA
jgi:GTP pyrophosphokinase